MNSDGKRIVFEMLEESIDDVLKEYGFNTKLQVFYRIIST